MLAKSPKVINPTDKHVGSRVRMRRKMLGLSQEKLGDALDLTFQQVQKYEKGANRIGASRLQQIAVILKVEVAFFFEGLAETAAAQVIVDGPGAASSEAVTDFLTDPGGLALLRSYQNITDAKLRRRVVSLVQLIAGDE